MINNIQFGRLALYIFICLAAGFIGSYFTQSSVSTWYVTLAKPSFNPPSWVFAPVWTILYILMAVSKYIICLLPANIEKKEAIIVFFTQLILNVLWSFTFFYLRSPLLGFINIIVLWVMIIFMIIRFYKLSPIAAWLQVPYFLWVSFASILNYYLWQLNS